MRPRKRVMLFMAPMTMALLMGLSGCVGGYGYVDEGPEWDGVLISGGGYDRDHHHQAFHDEGGHAGSERGRTSMGARAGGGGGGHAPSGGGGGHAGGGGGGGGHR